MAGTKRKAAAPKATAEKKAKSPAPAPDASKKEDKNVEIEAW